MPKTRDTVEFYAGDLTHLVQERLKPAFRSIWFVGGGTVSGECLRLGLADEVRYSIVPVLIGDGIPFFGGLDKDVALHLVEVKAYTSGMVALRHRCGSRIGHMDIGEAQREVRTRFAGGFYGQLVSGVLWLVSASLATWSTPRAAITTLVLGGFLIFPMTELLIRAGGAKSLSAQNSLHYLGMQVAFVLPLSMPLLLPVGLYRLDWFYPGLMILLGAHYIPFVFLYGMRMFAALAALLIGGGVVLAMYWPDGFSIGAWYTGAMLVLFAGVGGAIARREATN